MLLKTLPRMSRPHAAVELSVWALMAVPIGILSGGVAGVLANRLFEPVAPTWLLALAVALLTGAGPLANVGSVFWAHWSRGRAKVPASRRLQALLALALLAGSAVPLNLAGLVVLVVVIVTAQVLWCGIITIRASIWRRNYTRVARTTFAAQNQIIVSLISATIGATTGWLIEQNAAGFRLIFLLGAGCALLSLSRFRSVRLRRQRQLLVSEQVGDRGGGFSPGVYWSILTSDRLYRRYMICMMILGSGNLMFTAPLILIMTNHLGLPSFEQVLIAAAVPTLVAPFATPIWARVLAGHHVIFFRSRNSVFYALGILLLAIGVSVGSEIWLYAAAVVLGIGIGGGTLGWNLGHNDFASDARVAEYLGLHVSLTGIRGLFAPLAGVLLYGVLERIEPGLGRFSLLLPLTLTTSGVVGFWLLQRSLRRGAFPGHAAEQI